ncbi:TonB family protein [Spirosoma aerophilum]
MRNPLLFLLLICGSLSFAQQPIYKGFETDTAAVPRGGMGFLTSFIQANLRKPIAAEATGIGGRVIVIGVVEPDGRISDVKLLNSLQPDCDREAVRVCRLFNAWKPAYKGGKPVRQEVTVPVLFKANEPFIYVNGERINYFDIDKKALKDSSENARYKQITSLDTNGFANGDIIVYRGKPGKWKEEYRIPFVRQFNEGSGLLNQATVTIGYKNQSKLWEGEVLLLSESGSILSRSFYKNGLPGGVATDYNRNGLVARKTEEFDYGSIITTWYNNGQIREVLLNKKKEKPTDKPTPLSLLAHWSPTGEQLVRDGNGRAVYNETTNSRAIGAPKTTLVEQGMYENGFKQGLWNGHYADGSYFYEEVYEQGVCKGGKAKTIEKDTIRYTVQEELAEFKGGIQALGQFLSNTLRYPVDARRASVQGRVFVSFVINTDGSVDEIQPLNKLGYGTEEEAIWVVKKTGGRWKPGSQRGEPIRVKYNLPINFTLQ